MKYTKEQLDLILDDIKYDGMRVDANYNALKVILFSLEKCYARKHEFYISHVVLKNKQRSIAEQNNVSHQSVSHHILFYRAKLSNKNKLEQIEKGITCMTDVTEDKREFLPDMVDINKLPLNIDTYFIYRVVKDCYEDFEFVAMDYVIFTIILDNIKMSNYRDVNIYYRHIVKMQSASELGIDFRMTELDIKNILNSVRMFIKLYYKDYGEKLCVPMGSIVNDNFIYKLCTNAGYPVMYGGTSEDDLIGLNMEVLGLSSATYNALGRAGITTVEQLESYFKEKPPKSIKGIGDLRMREIREAYNKFARGTYNED